MQWQLCNALSSQTRQLKYVTHVNVSLKGSLASRMNPKVAPMLCAPGAPLNSLDAIDQKGGPGLVHCQACQTRCPCPRLHSAPNCPCRMARGPPSLGSAVPPPAGAPALPETSKLARQTGRNLQWRAHDMIWAVIPGKLSKGLMPRGCAHHGLGQTCSWPFPLMVQPRHQIRIKIVSLTVLTVPATSNTIKAMAATLCLASSDQPNLMRHTVRELAARVHLESPEGGYPLGGGPSCTSSGGVSLLCWATIRSLCNVRNGPLGIAAADSRACNKS